MNAAKPCHAHLPVHEDTANKRGFLKCGFNNFGIYHCTKAEYFRMKLKGEFLSTSLSILNYSLLDIVLKELCFNPNQFRRNTMKRDLSLFSPHVFLKYDWCGFRLHYA